MNDIHSPYLISNAPLRGLRILVCAETASLCAETGSLCAETASLCAETATIGFKRCRNGNF